MARHLFNRFDFKIKFLKNQILGTKTFESNWLSLLVIFDILAFMFVYFCISIVIVKTYSWVKQRRNDVGREYTSSVFIEQGNAIENESKDELKTKLEK